MLHPEIFSLGAWHPQAKALAATGLRLLPCTLAGLAVWLWSGQSCGLPRPKPSAIACQSTGASTSALARVQYISMLWRFVFYYFSYPLKWFLLW